MCVWVWLAVMIFTTILSLPRTCTLYAHMSLFSLLLPMFQCSNIAKCSEVFALDISTMYFTLIEIWERKHFLFVSVIFYGTYTVASLDAKYRSCKNIGRGSWRTGEVVQQVRLRHHLLATVFTVESAVLSIWFVSADHKLC